MSNPSNVPDSERPRGLRVAGVMAVVVLAGLLLVVLVGRLLQSMQRNSSSEQARQEFVSRWSPPADRSFDQMFPEPVQGRTVVRSTTNRPPPELEVKWDGAHAVYQRPGHPDVEVFVSRPPARERAETIRQLRDRLKNRPGMLAEIEVADRWRFRGGEPEETWEIWSVRDWLLLFRSSGELHADFIRAYLMAVTPGTGEGEG